MNETYERIIEIVNSNIENSDLTLEQTNEDLSRLGMDSITFIRIIVALEDEFGLEIPDEYLLMTEMTTISKMADVLSAEINTKVQE